MASLEGKVIVVTGAATGIGRATAQILASRGAILSIADLNKEGLDETLASLQPNSSPTRNHLATHLDVSSSSAVNEWIKHTVQKLGPLSGAANVAGVSLGLKGVAIRDSPDRDWDFVMDVNAKGVFYCLRAQLALGGLVDGGSIVNVASVSGLRALANTASYVASKHAVVGLTKTAAREEGPNGIRVNCVAPGFIQTPMTAVLGDNSTWLTAGQSMPQKKGNPEDVGYLIAYLLSDEARFTTGACYGIDGGWTA